MDKPRKKYFKQRAHWLLDPWIIGTILILFLSGVPIVLWLASYDSVIAVAMFSITYLTLLVTVVGYIKRSLLEPEIVHDEKKTEAAKKELEAHRVRARQEFIQAELDSLARGEQVPVLDIWQLKEELLKRHPFFPALEKVLMDPVQKELWIRVKVGKLNLSGAKERTPFDGLLNQVAAFVAIVARDEYLTQLHSYFSTVVIELYSLKETEGSIDEPYPIYSSLLSRNDLQHFLSASPSWGLLSKLGEHRFANGAAIEPHRGIQGSNIGGLM